MRYNRGFTLIEIVISITLLGMIFLFLFDAINNLTYSDALLKNKQQSILKQTKNLNIFKEDIFNAVDINISGKSDFNIITLQTDYSLHGIFRPFVTWLVLRDGDTLVRLESSHAIKLPLNYEQVYLPYIDVVIPQIDKFRLLPSKNKTTFLLYLETENSEIVTEIYKPMK